MRQCVRPMDAVTCVVAALRNAEVAAAQLLALRAVDAVAMDGQPRGVEPVEVGDWKERKVWNRMKERCFCLRTLFTKLMWDPDEPSVRGVGWV